MRIITAIENFKGIRDRVGIELKPITLLFEPGSEAAQQYSDDGGLVLPPAVSPCQLVSHRQANLAGPRHPGWLARCPHFSDGNCCESTTCTKQGQRATYLTVGTLAGTLPGVAA